MDNLHLNSSFFDVSQKSLDTEVSKSIGQDLSFAGFQDQPGSRAIIQDMMKLVELSVNYFYKKKDFKPNQTWGVGEAQICLIEQRLREVYPLSYDEYISVFSYMAMTVNTAENFVYKIAGQVLPKRTILQKALFIKAEKSDCYLRLMTKANFFKVYSLVIRGLYLRYEKITVSEWNDVNNKLVYIKSAEAKLRFKNPEFVNVETNRISPHGLMFLKEDFQKKFESGYDGIVDDFPTLAETWIRGAVTAKHSLKYTDRKRFEGSIRKLIGHHEQLAQTVIDLHDLERNYGAVQL